MSSVTCNYCNKPLQKGIQDGDKYYCGRLHKALDNPEQPIQGGIGAIVLGLVFLFFLPEWTIRGTPAGPLLLGVGIIVLLFGLVVMFVFKPGNISSSPQPDQENM